MSMQSEGKDAKGRNWDQVTRDGSSSAGSMGVGGTGDIGGMPEQKGGQQTASRTDDLLAGNTTLEESDQAFAGSAAEGQLKTGMEGIGRGSGNRSGSAGGNMQSGQSAGSGESNRQGLDPMPPSDTDPDQYDQGTAAPER